MEPSVTFQKTDGGWCDFLKTFKATNEVAVTNYVIVFLVAISFAELNREGLASPFE